MLRTKVKFWDDGTVTHTLFDDEKVLGTAGAWCHHMYGRCLRGATAVYNGDFASNDFSTITSAFKWLITKHNEQEVKNND